MGSKYGGFSRNEVSSLARFNTTEAGQEEQTENYINLQSTVLIVTSFLYYLNNFFIVFGHSSVHIGKYLICGGKFKDMDGD